MKEIKNSKTIAWGNGSAHTSRQNEWKRSYQYCCCMLLTIYWVSWWWINCSQTKKVVYSVFQQYANMPQSPQYLTNFWYGEPHWRKFSFKTASKCKILISILTLFAFTFWFIVVSRKLFLRLFREAFYEAVKKPDWRFNFCTIVRVRWEHGFKVR